VTLSALALYVIVRPSRPQVMEHWAPPVEAPLLSAVLHCKCSPKAALDIAGLPLLLEVGATWAYWMVGFEGVPKAKCAWRVSSFSTDVVFCLSG